MRTIIVFIVSLLAGCQVAPKAEGPQPAPPIAAALETPKPDVEKRRTAQLIEALVNQNDALRAELKAERSNRAQPQVTLRPADVPSVPAPIPSSPTTESYVSPNAQGVIDLAQFERPDPNEPVNPFVVRKDADENVREIEIHVAGIVSGTEPMALVNGDLVRAGANVSGLVVKRVETSAVIFEHKTRRVRIPVGERGVRLRMAN